MQRRQDMGLVVGELGGRGRRRGWQHAEAALGREQLHPRELEGGAILRNVRPCLLQERECAVRIDLEQYLLATRGRGGRAGASM